MNNRNNNQDIFEHYVDATVALFMEQYSAILSDSICAEIKITGDEDIVFPESLDKRCRSLIKKECARQRRKQVLNGITKGFKYVAIFAVVLLSLASLLFMTVDAFRMTIINFYIEHSGGQWDIGIQNNSHTHVNSPTINISDPLVGLIPEHYQLAVLEGDSLSELTAIYEDPNGKQIFFSATTGENWITVDSECAQFSQALQISGQDAVLVIEDENIRVVWLCEEISTAFTLIANGLSDSEVIDIADQLIGIIIK